MRKAAVYLALIVSSVAPAWAHLPTPSTDQRLFRLELDGRVSHVLLMDHAAVDTTSFETQALTRLVERSCELLLDPVDGPSLDADVPFHFEGLSLTAREVLHTLGLGALGGSPLALADAWRTIQRALDAYLANQMDAYGEARATGASLKQFGRIKLDEGYHLAAQLLFQREFSDEDLIDAAQAWSETDGLRWATDFGMFRVWAEAHLPADARGVTELTHHLRASLARLDALLGEAAKVTPRRHAATNFWNASVSVYLRGVLTQRFYRVPLPEYLMVRAALEQADAQAFVTLRNDRVTDAARDPGAWAARIVDALGDGQALVVVDPAVALPPRTWSLLDHLLLLGVRVTPVPLRGQRPRVVN